MSIDGGEEKQPEGIHGLCGILRVYSGYRLQRSGLAKRICVKIGSQVAGILAAEAEA